ncbi:DUF4913 domain-containing protein [Nocardia salmonicida]|uniref:DUF4913 domain-containing protein n=1 Tax=Nocardia salmonicida TaxID=53431 RepID=UPI00340D9F69
MTANEPAEEEAPDIHDDAGQWVDTWLVPALEGKFTGGDSGMVLCKEWYRHPLVCLRLTALWREWEEANRKKEMSSWWVYHYDAHARVLFDSERGPMYRCANDHRESDKTFRPNGVPPGWFDQTDSGPDFTKLTQ